jgi:hypothetical protein
LELAIQFRVPRDHLDRKVRQNPLPACSAHPLAERFVVQQPGGPAGELHPVAQRHQISRFLVDHQLAVAGNVRGDHRHGRGHGLQDRIRLAFVAAAQPQEVEMRHEP